MKASSLTAEQVTKRFYQHFSGIRSSFLASLHGIEADDTRQAYVSLLLNRLLFVFFLQCNGFLDADPQYLSHRLQIIRTQFGPDTFFRLFLLRFFYEGLCSPLRTSSLLALFGTVPYLEETLFLPHPLEESPLSITDDAFCSLFAFLETYHWSLDEQQLGSEHTITPALLGHIFELSVNQQEMGAYYTPEDVTAYIARNTLIPYLFSEVALAIPTEFSPTGPIWHYLRRTPERYIQPTLASSVRQPSETASEYAARQARYQELHILLASGALCSIDDCITYNLDIITLAQDILLHLASPELLLNFYQALQRIRILDPTCGSGAFLFAALTLLLPLHEACLTRMHTFLEKRTNLSATFRTILAQATSSSNLRSFILHTILTHNLYGVDLMPEAIELCKLRFSLLLLAEVTPSPSPSPLLPSLTPHLRTGNALVGFVATPDPKQPHSQDALDRLLAQEYGIAHYDEPTFTHWRAQHQPMHWSSLFQEVMEQGGFSVILGNPPYVEYDTRTFPYALRNFQTLPCANLYPCVIERSYHLLSRHGRIGMILPLAAFATRNMLPLLNSVRSWFPGSWLSFYHFRPSMLFSGGKIASIPTLILLGRLDGPEQRFSTHLLKWCKEQRSQLFSSLSYCAITAPRDPSNPHYYPKFGQPCENTIMGKVLRHPRIRSYLASAPNHNTLSYRSAGGLYWKVFLNFPWPYQTTSNKQCSFQLAYDRDVFVALLNSSLFWWYYTVTFDSFNLKDYMLFGFRFSYPDDLAVVQTLKILCHQLMDDFCLHARHLKRGETDSYTIYAKKSKPLLDEIDRVLAQLYGLTPEEYAFIISYDLKYRLGNSCYD